MDFYQIRERSARNGVLEIYPDFRVCRSKDLMIRGKCFYAIWDEENHIWSTDEYDVQRLVDKDLEEHRIKIEKRVDDKIRVLRMSDFSSGIWREFRNYMNNLSDNAKELDQELTFSNTEIKKTSYISKKLPYPLQSGSIDAYDEIIGTLYEPEERAKLEWAIGSIIAGDAKHIQKFIVLYGEQGAGKSTILNIIQSLFQGYYTTFDAKSLVSSSNAFSTEAFKTNPLVAIQHDGDLSRIEDNTKLNSIVSHEEMTINEKFKPSYTSRINSFLFMATNKPVKITDAKSGIIRRLIDVKPSGKKIPVKHYHTLIQQVDFELGAIAQHCLDIYLSMGKNYYNSYKPLDMIFTTDVFFNFVESHFAIFKDEKGISLSQAYELYKVYCDESMIDYKLAKYKFREELKNYFDEFHQVTRVDGKQIRSYYTGFQIDKFTQIQPSAEIEIPNSLVIDSDESIFDSIAESYPAQYATKKGTPKEKWDETKTTLKDIDTKKLHYVKVPLNHIVIDFDLKDESGKKDLELNLEAASKWPPTYSEFSKSGKGIHLHYIYDGDPEQLSRIYEEDIEVKVFVGNSSLRRQLSKCNNLPIATISSGLPMKGVKMLNFEAVKSERSLRDLISRNLNKEIHPGTKPSMDFIHKILEDAYSDGLNYDVTDLRNQILAFANNSTNQADYCLKLIPQMKFKSDDISEPYVDYDDKPLVFFDVEVFPNLFTIVYKVQGDHIPVKMINPGPREIEDFLKLKLVGFNNRRYDNHILYARYLGYDNMQLFKLSQKIVVDKSRNAMFGEAYNLSYTDVYDFSSDKKGLKKWQIELGLNHSELGLRWDEPVPEELWEKVLEYNVNDVITLEQVFDHLQADYQARQILSELSGLSMNDTTQNHAARIIFGKDRTPQDKFIYTDLGEEFPGYKYSFGKSIYRGEDPKEGGYVYAEPGMYSNVVLLDVASMHPTSLINLRAFGPYTDRYIELVNARLAIKNKDFEKARTLLGGILEKYLATDEMAEQIADQLAFSLKIVINIVYGLTSAKFDNKFKDPRNVDNIVAKRGALFMIDLKHAVQEQGYTVAHIKTDSIKIPNADDKIIEFVKEFGLKYGYIFDHEATYEKMCLVNDSVFISKYGWAMKEKLIGSWNAVGLQFAEPYVFKTLFSKEPIIFEDKCETKAVQTAIYLDMNESLPEDEHDYIFIGKAGQFCPMKPGSGGGILLRDSGDKFHAVSGSKGYRWMESEMVKELGLEKSIDDIFFRKKVDEAIAALNKFGDSEWFMS